MDPNPDLQSQNISKDNAKEDIENASATSSLSIPTFYFKIGRPPSNPIKNYLLSRIHRHFDNYSNRLSIENFKTVTMFCNLPSFFCGTFFRRIDTKRMGIITSDDFIKFWVDENIVSMDKATQVFRILKQPDNNYLTKKDFEPIIEEFVETHPYLKFLQNVPSFQKRYAETVIYTIFYYVDHAGHGCITLKDLKHGDLILALQKVQEDEDLDESNFKKYFSYKQFYVLYCKFCELDFDYDFLLDKYDLMRYGNNALSSRIIERIFSQFPRKFTSEIKGKMGYEDFVYFMLAEEYKSSQSGVKYWFRCIDLSGNGVIGRNDLQFFIEEQLHRIECMDLAVVLFKDIFCQIHDMIHSDNKGFFTLSDFEACQLSGVVFDLIFNVVKYRAYEKKEISMIENTQNDSNMTEWAFFEYFSLVKNRIEDAEADVCSAIDDEISALY